VVGFVVSTFERILILSSTVVDLRMYIERILSSQVVGFDRSVVASFQRKKKQKKKDLYPTVIFILFLL
jgi:hypothetical protein